MKVIGINGSPRKNWNTATLLTNALEGAASQGAETEIVHLYDLDFKGCTSCFACKIIDSPSKGRCAVKDGLSPLLKKIETEADAIILGSPIYFGSITGEMRSFMERLLFAPLVYTKPPQSIFPRKIRTGIIYTMNVPGSTGFCGSINASEQEENIFEFSAKFMYIATDNENNLTRACYEGACASPFEALNGFQYHSNWLQNMQLCWS